MNLLPESPQTLQPPFLYYIINFPSKKAEVAITSCGILVNYILQLGIYQDYIAKYNVLEYVADKTNEYDCYCITIMRMQISKFQI